MQLKPNVIFDKWYKYEDLKMGYWGRYVPVETRRKNALKKIAKLEKSGKKILPVVGTGRKICHSFWGKAWCSQIESFSDFENRLPRGRTYVRNGSVCHLDIQEGQIQALVIGSSLYDVSIQIQALRKERWEGIREKSIGMVGSFLELLQGKVSTKVLELVTDTETGLFPKQSEIRYSCSCPDWAGMCKHVAAVLYGVANRLDSEPELLFVLRGVKAEDLISADIALPVAQSADEIDDIAAVFDIELEE